MNVFVFAFTFLCAIVLGFCLLCYYHEQVHVENLRLLGIPSHIEYYGFMGRTIPDVNYYYSDDDKLQSNIMNGLNESISYQIAPMVAIICFVLFLCTWYLGDKIKELGE